MCCILHFYITKNVEFPLWLLDFRTLFRKSFITQIDLKNYAIFSNAFMVPPLSN